ncbi:MAG: radical SAM family heme chaperone HemW [Oscillospiraceae bacterium]|nr:radical SAM family heme chaperone HemW [Oscillospiraceae bacterium]
MTNKRIPQRGNLLPPSGGTRRKPIGLYVHVPFCKSKCNYCSFYSVEYREALALEYKFAVIRNVKHWAKVEDVVFDTVFFGGGTPSLFYKEIAEIMQFIPLTTNAEITIEANPDDVNQKMLQTLKGVGVNRLSIGVQSLDDSVLYSLGRRHDSLCATKAIEQAHTEGFTNISVDIMLGIPEQDLLSDLKKICTLPINHLSCYMYESSNTIDEFDQSDLYLKAVDFLESSNLHQYEISNFGRPCKHNLKYWRCEEYVGIGSAAHSYYGGKRFAVSEDVEAFILADLQETYITEENPGSSEEQLMLGLRLCEGVMASPKQLEKAQSLPSEYVCVRSGEQKNLSLTAKGFLVSNSIIAKLLD